MYTRVYICVVHMCVYAYVVLKPREVGGGSQHVASEAMCLGGAKRGLSGSVDVMVRLCDL